MNLACTFEYVDDAVRVALHDEVDLSKPITGAIITNGSKGTLMTWVPDPDEPGRADCGHAEQFDLLENVEIHENPDDTYRIVADSMRAEGAFGPGNSLITLKVVPR
jgi:hypothetical protein